MSPFLIVHEQQDQAAKLNAAIAVKLEKMRYAG